ncbi:AraC family transcriptional regulator [Paucibacter sp. O1-1]|uniref:cupin domain-containing protein n=1 Tax=unclassified Roseateles TaxID=2626991 RepID=UPI0021D490C9|nr:MULTISPECIES: AraC family transcriptional regulator [unclassified Roseateles]MCU7370761.1 AraC family transcriptional regulator [Paucibacter sp. O1-1]MCZ7881537.1 AraC family transcriptional regulator [Paucibacter sp. M5-1]MDA3825748.1 AraC family transcriptional regulator [Paucibacter sp. O1-1]MDC6169455.1 AraC family transcriptional regulator [Paucibacter sp. XJ19-41]
MDITSFEHYRQQALAAGFDEVLERRWAPLTVVDEHSHPFVAKAVMAEGEMWLTVAGQTRHLRVGDGFELAAGERHAERYGAAGAVYWVARRAA